MIGRAVMPPGRGFCMTTLTAVVVLTAAARAEIVNRIVATIDGEPITAHEVAEFATSRGAKIPPSQLLDAFITERLLEREVKAQGIDVGEAEVDAYIAQVRTRNRMNEAQFAAALEGQGMTPERYRAQVRHDIERMRLVNREIRARVNVSPQEIARYYQANLDDYATTERVTVRSIFIARGGIRARERVAEIAARARAGEDFEALARELSEGPGAEDGGRLGTFGRGELAAPLDAAVFALEPGAVSEPIETANGWHVLRVDEREAGSHRPLDEVADEIRESLYARALETRFDRWLTEGLRERYHVEVLE